ncbi:hypothetical protein [Marinilactibacillus psychrotolerans]
MTLSSDYGSDEHYIIEAMLTNENNSNYYEIDTNEKFALEIKIPTSEISDDPNDMIEFDQTISDMGLSRTTEGEKSIISGKMDYAEMQKFNFLEIGDIMEYIVIYDNNDGSITIFDDVFIEK